MRTAQRGGEVTEAPATAGVPLTQVIQVITFTLVSAEPITGLSGKRYGEVLLVEQGVERFENKSFVSLGSRFAHFGSPWFCRQRFSQCWPSSKDYIHTL